MPAKPHAKRPEAIALLRAGKTPAQVLEVLPGVSRAIVYRWAQEEKIPPRWEHKAHKLHGNGKRIEKGGGSIASEEIVSALLYRNLAAAEGAPDLPTDREIGEAWGVSRARVGQIKGWILDGKTGK